MIFESCRSDFAGVDQEELLEIMDIHNCRRLPKADNTEQILRELAHQKLIQEPAFVIEQWSNTLAPVRSELKGIALVYEELQPTSRKIMRSITYPSSQNAQEKQIVKYVNAYLRASLSASHKFRDFREDLLLIHVAVTWSCQSVMTITQIFDMK